MQEWDVRALNAALNIDGIETILMDAPEECTEILQGWKHTDEAREKISESLRVRMSDPKEREKISNTLTGVKHTEERKKNISDGLYRQKFKKYAKLYEFEWNGQIIKEINTIKSLSRKYNIPKTTLLRKLGRIK